ncbi:MAG: hypothetical protein ACHQHN_08915 [Sphingobacteriales bacterium]
MKTTLFVLLLALALFASCSGDNNSQQLQSKIDSLQQRLNNTYKPGLGEFMLGIQQHHAKLWFAGTNANWALADFEVHEIGETLDDIKEYCTDRPEIKSIDMINPAIASINAAIKQKDVAAFKKGFVDLTNNCNNCHKDNKHEFNVITIPTTVPVTNQEFKPGK